ncbi:MAG: DHHA1 domain-containing protein, partial [Pseudomonadales bacterium]
QAQLDDIEQRVNVQILGNSETGTRLMALDDALETGAMAMFGEKYDAEVRVLTIGQTAEQPYSVELCGGTHVTRAGDIGLFKVLSESSVGAGVRRIEALTNSAALDYVKQNEALLLQITETAKSSRERLLEDVEKLISERKRLTNEIKSLKEGDALGKLTDQPPEIAGTHRYLGAAVDGLQGRELKDLVRKMLDDDRADVICLISATAKNAGVVVGVSKGLSKTLPAKELLNAAMTALGGGGGGGSPTLAQGASKAPLADAQASANALARIKAQLANA